METYQMQDLIDGQDPQIIYQELEYGVFAAVCLSCGKEWFLPGDFDLDLKQGKDVCLSCGPSKWVEC